jgi:hypothetical protein
MMTVRQRHYLLMAMWPAYGVAVMVLTVFVSRQLWFLLFLGLIGFGVYGMSLRCPNCGNPIERNRWKFWTVWVPRHCRSCGADLEAIETPQGRPGS